ncbi:hypothetical protein LEP1GSC196_2650 [Leptospira meyeri serovar Semaranga str. Veldrot Semarang 173]|nr:hypothetical protein LEP1GSC196_2650 [Leptospira meyeri serovar Semaranga str. Veldrot Semarang 173]
MTVYVLNIITGVGKLGISQSKNSRPLIPGISTSKLITSGRSRGTNFFASKAFAAVPTTCMVLLLANISESTFLTTFWSSTINSLIMIRFGAFSEK